MAHIMKHNKSSLGHMLKHYERAKDENGDYIKFGNQNIDTSKTSLNYNLAENRYITQFEFIQKRCSEVYCMNRDDVNLMCSWVVTAPKDLKEDEYEKFFRDTFNFLSNRYGKENVVSSFVHMDEVTPHMHFAFVPVTFDKKKNRYKVSAFEVISKKELNVFHKDLDEYLENSFGRKLDILNSATRDGNKTIQELKFLKSSVDLDKLQNTLLERSETVSKLKAYILSQERVKMQNRGILTQYKGGFKIGKGKNQVDLEIYEPKTAISILGDNVVIPRKLFNELKDVCLKTPGILSELECLKDDNKKLKSKIDKLEKEQSIKSKMDFGRVMGSKYFFAYYDEHEEEIERYKEEYNAKKLKEKMNYSVSNINDFTRDRNIDWDLER